MSVNSAKMARLGGSIAPFVQYVKLYYIKLLCKIRKQGVLCPLSGFFFCGKGGALLKLYA